MRIFFSAVKKNEKLEWLLKNGATSFLFSYEDKKVINQIAFLNQFTEYKFTILVDSGAFSAWNRGLVVDIDHYCDFINRVKEMNSHHTIYFINLDVIPHKKGTKPTKIQIADACKKGIENYFYMKDKGHSTIHTFHQFEDYETLDYIVKNCNDNNYIGVSPANDQSLEERNKFLSRVFYKLRDTTRVHVLGLTARDSLEKFPTYSADSSSWINVARFGELFDYQNLEKMPKKDLSKENWLYYDPEQDFQDTFRYYINLEKYITNLWKKRGVTWRE